MRGKTLRNFYLLLFIGTLLLSSIPALAEDGWHEITFDEAYQLADRLNEEDYILIHYHSGYYDSVFTDVRPGYKNPVPELIQTAAEFPLPVYGVNEANPGGTFQPWWESGMPSMKDGPQTPVAVVSFATGASQIFTGCWEIPDLLDYIEQQIQIDQPPEPIPSLEGQVSVIQTSGGTESYNQNYCLPGNTIDQYTGYPVTSNLTATDTGFQRVEFIETQGVVIEQYDKNKNLLQSQTIQPELPLFGGFYETDDSYILVFGQINYEESDTCEVIRTVKYSKEWQRLGAASLYGANTSIPFEAGSLRMTDENGILYVRTCHEMYRSDDGLNHQANLTYSVRLSDMTILDSQSEVSNPVYGYVSHSFNQFIDVTDGVLSAVDLGDAYPRAVVLSRYRAPLDNGIFTADTCDSYELLPIYGEIGDNRTGVTLGGFAVTDQAYLTVGTTVPQDENWNLSYKGQVFLSVAPRNGTENHTLRFLTDNAHPSTPYLVSLSDGRLIVLWQHIDRVYYQFLRADGSADSELYSVEAKLSDCPPIEANGQLVWYVTDYQSPIFYSIALTSALESTEGDIILQIGNPSMRVFGTVQPIDSLNTAPFIQNDSTLVPIRAIAEALGASVSWDGTSQTATIHASNGDMIVLTIGQTTASINGVQQILPVAPLIQGNRTYLPLRFVGEALGCDVIWQQEQQIIVLNRRS